MADIGSSTATSISAITLASTDTAGDRTESGCSVAIAAPPVVAFSTATVTVSSGNITGFTITNPGLVTHPLLLSPSLLMVREHPLRLLPWQPSGFIWMILILHRLLLHGHLITVLYMTKFMSSLLMRTAQSLELLEQSLKNLNGLSKAPDQKDDVNQSNYYKDVINQRSKWIWWSDHPTAWTNVGTATSGTAGGTEYGVMVSGDSQQIISLTGGVDGSPAASDVQAGYLLFANDELVDVSLIMASAHNTTTADYIIDNVTAIRKDCLVFISPQRASVVNNEGSEVTDITGSSDFVRLHDLLLLYLIVDGSTCMTDIMTDTSMFL